MRNRNFASVLAVVFAAPILAACGSSSSETPDSNNPPSAADNPLPAGTMVSCSDLLAGTVPDVAGYCDDNGATVTADVYICKDASMVFVYPDRAYGATGEPWHDWPAQGADDPDLKALIAGC